MSHWQQKENVIKEQRTIEAARNNLMGPSGKLGTIARFLGQPIVSQSNPLYDVNYLNYESDYTNEHFEETASGQKGPLTYREEIAEMGEEASRIQGFLFDGLNQGIHLEIQYWLESTRFVVTYKGYCVYKEIAGELEVYVPADEWEEHVEKLFKRGQAKIKKVKESNKAEETVLISKKKNSILQILRDTWGI